MAFVSKTVSMRIFRRVEKNAFVSNWNGPVFRYLERSAHPTNGRVDGID